MADIIDIANNLAEIERESLIKNRRETVKLEPLGYCQNPNCELDVDENQLFCNSDCAKEFEKSR